MEDRKYTLEELKEFSIHGNKTLFFQDFWLLKDQYLSIPKEQQDPLTIVPVLVFLKVLSGKLDEAKELAKTILDYPDPKSEYVYHNISLLIPSLTFEELEFHADALRNIDLPIMGLAFCGGRPSVINGYRDFSYFGDLLYKQKDRFLRLLDILYDESADAMYRVGKAEYLYQTNQCLKSMVRISELIPELEKAGDVKLLFTASCLQMQLLVVNGEVNSAVQMVKQIRNQVENRATREQLYNLDALETKVAIYEGNYDIVTQWLKDKAPDEYSNFNMQDLYGYLVKIRCYILTGKFIAGLALISRLQPLLEKGLRPMDLCEVEILIAIGGYKADLKKECFNAIKRAIDLGCKYNYLRLFADEGEPMLKVLNAYKKAEPEAPHQDFIKKLIEITRATALLYPNYLLEPYSKKIELTIHELDILKLLSHGLTYEEIAGQSNISINTVRYHIKKIYEKLDVTSASEALSRARTMDLLK